MAEFETIDSALVRRVVGNGGIEIRRCRKICERQCTTPNATKATTWVDCVKCQYREADQELFEKEVREILSLEDRARVIPHKTCLGEHPHGVLSILWVGDLGYRMTHRGDGGGSVTVEVKEYPPVTPIKSLKELLADQKNT